MRHSLEDRDHFDYCAHLLFAEGAALGLMLNQGRFESVRTQDAEKDRWNQEAWRKRMLRKYFKKEVGSNGSTAKTV